MDEAGILYLCATPIGNLEDITLRVLKTLKEVDLVAAEDTRRTVNLLNHFQIKTPIISYHEHNKEKRGREIIEKLLAGHKIALVADAGTPGISDPGFELIQESIHRGIKITSLPGPCAAVTAVTVSGFTINRFVFYGFLSRKKKDRRREIEEIIESNKTVVIYEAPHRLLKTLKELLEAAGDRDAAVCRELSKLFEEVKRGSLSQLIHDFEVKAPKGEITLIIGANKEAVICSRGSLTQGVEEVRQLKEAGLKEKEAVKRTAKYLNLPSRELYKKVIEEKEG
ncbi:16S rRNA (cytidine(1402)-2'-O)-methyltransferase [Candidatus Contubernalis alkaliaceticus]|uniref:16S rRNA (cytidine(1402)-2'-O)-methyltransferase n=1 Tax=Candidatus Contubernalis alkaliaceticus TaxID=338645 RepID=UPI001F4C4EEB|nr:16S rRNA (cytidine(1402)-2'-O)-methyltransferase [Candidatus Contubernalis alkalaceticus]UNC90678.1 16S rRNA (cytidine(1402)-2'-O)-methyltransferase [Candidatus Contubernalis alkalaceticus]